MCIGVPGKITQFKGPKAQVKQGGHTHWISFLLVPDLAVGDWVLTYQNTAINKISAEEARRTIKFLQNE